MPTPGGTITRKDLIEDDALNYGPQLAKNIKPAIEAQDQLAESAKAYGEVIKSFKKSESQADFLTAKQQEKILYIESTNAIKLEQTSLIAAEKTKQEVIKTRKAELDVIAKEERAKNSVTKLTIEERVQNEANNRVIRQQVREQLGLVGAYEKMNKARTEAKNKLRDLIATEGVSIQEIKKAQKEFDVLAAKVKKADDATDDFTKNVGNYPTIGKLAGGVKELFGAFGLAAGIGAAVSILKGAFNTIKEFDQGIADLAAITGASGKDLEYLKNQAVELGKETKGGAIKVVEAYKLIASAKPELLENVESLNQVTKAVLTLSRASGLELPEAATALTDAMNQFGAPAEEAGIFIDALANGAKFGAAEIPQVTEALLKFGAVARSSNISIQESTALIELLAENGIKGAEAGTALRNVLLKISAPDALPKEAQKALRDLGISFELLKDKSVPIQQKFEALKPLLADNGKLLKAFGFENTVAARNIIEHTDRLKDLTGKMFEYGTAQEQAEIRSNTLQGKTERLSATYDSFILSLNSGKGSISIFLGEVIELFDYMLEGLIRMNTSWDDLNKKAAESGKSRGLETFQKQFQSLRTNGVSDMEALTSVLGQARLDIVRIDKELKDARKNDTVSDAGALARGVLGLPTGRDAKVEVERLIAKRAELLAIIKQANTKIAQENIKQTNEEKKKNEIIIALSKAELKAIEDARKAAEKARKDYLARMKQADDDAFALLKFRKEQEIKISDEIAVNDKEAIDERIDALLNGNRVEESLAEATAKHKLRQLSQFNDEVRDLTNQEIDNLINGLEIKKTLSDAETLVLEEFIAKKREIKLKEKDDTQKIIDAIVDQEKKKVEALIQIQQNEENKLLTNENTTFKSNKDALKADLDAGIIAQNEYFQKLEDLQLDHEEEILKIKKDFAKQGLQTQIDAIEAFLRKQETVPEKDKISAEKREQIESDLIKAKKLLSEEDLVNTDLTTEKKLEKEREYTQKVLELSSAFTSEIGNLANVIFDNRISKIDAEMQQWDEYYAEQIRLAGDDQRQKDLLAIDAEKKRKELEDKKRKEQHKQAVLNKTMSALQIGISTAMAIMQSYAQLGPIGGSAGAILVGALGAIQLAAVLAAPIPKYEKGTKSHKGGLAEVGEVRPEVVIEPGKNPYIVSNPQILNLAKGTQVIPSLEQYQKEFGQDNMDSMLKSSQGKINDYNYLYQLNFHSKEMIEEMRLTRKAIEKNKPQRPIAQKGADIPHSIWAYTNTKWS